MSFRSGINQVNGSNFAPINTFSFSISSVVSATRSNLPIDLGAGTYKCSLSYQVGISGTGSILLSNFNTGLSSATFANPIAPMPLSATTTIQLAGGGGQVFNAGTGFTDFRDTFIVLSAPTTIYLYSQMNYSIDIGAPVVGITNTVTFTRII